MNIDFEVKGHVNTGGDMSEYLFLRLRSCLHWRGI